MPISIICSKCGAILGSVAGQISPMKPIQSFFCCACAEKQKWPKHCTAYVHGSKDIMWERGTELGLTGEALSKFSYALSELTVSLTVDEDGSYTINEIKE